MFNLGHEESCNMKGVHDPFMDSTDQACEALRSVSVPGASQPGAFPAILTAPPEDNIEMCGERGMKSLPEDDEVGLRLSTKAGMRRTHSSMLRGSAPRMLGGSAGFPRAETRWHKLSEHLAGLTHAQVLRGQGCSSTSSSERPEE